MFAFAAVAKARSFHEMESLMRSVDFLPPLWVRTVAVAVLLAEATAAILLGVPATRRAGYLVAFGLASSFFGFAALRLRTGSTLPCNCFGTVYHLSPVHSAILCAGLALVSANAYGNIYRHEK